MQHHHHRARNEQMPLYMDVHHLSDTLDLTHVADDHAADLRFQGNHNVRYLRYWVDEVHGRIFCLVEAPYAEAAKAVHREARNPVTDEIYEVHEGA
jgi:D-alanyl-D-alanine dipeptidase